MEGRADILRPAPASTAIPQESEIQEGNESLTLTTKRLRRIIKVMEAVISAPKSWVASVGRLSLPKKTAKRLQTLMDRNNDGELTALEKRELAALVEWSENVSLIRAQALQLLGRQPA